MRVVVAGGGISGLALAHALRERGAEPVLFEADKRVGGKVGSVRDAGFVTENGPNGFLDKEPAVRELVGKIGLTDALVPANDSAKKRFLWSNGGLRPVPMSPQSFLQSPLLPKRAKLRLALEMLVPRKRSDRDESILAFASRRLGPRAARALVDPMVAGIYAGDASKLSLRSSFPRMVELERDHRSLLLAMMKLGRGGAPSGRLHTFREGMGQVVGTLAQSLGDIVHPATGVQQLTRDETGWTVSASGQTTRADAVVLAIPAYASAPLVSALPGGAKAADALRNIPYAAVAVVHLGYKRAAIPHPLDGFGFLVPSNEDLDILGTLFPATIFEGRAPEGTAVLTSMVGGARRPDLLHADDEGLIEVVRTSLVRAVGVRARPIWSRVVRWPRAIPQYTVGHAQRVEAARSLERRNPGLWLAGNALQGVSFNDCVKNASLVADRVVAQA